MLEPASYYVVLDLEATCDDRGTIPREDSEIIEIGAVLVEGASLRTVAEFQTFVRPVVHPRLTPFCIELTTITPEQVQDALLFPAAAARVAAFGAGALFCSWGNYDRNQLAADARRHDVAPPLGPRHINLKDEFAKLEPRRKRGNRDALARVGLEATGVHHRGLDDARNIARLLPYILRRVELPTSGRDLRP